MENINSLINVERLAYECNGKSYIINRMNDLSRNQIARLAELDELLQVTEDNNQFMDAAAERTAMVIREPKIDKEFVDENFSGYELQSFYTAFLMDGNKERLAETIEKMKAPASTHSET